MRIISCLRCPTLQKVSIVMLVSAAVATQGSERGHFRHNNVRSGWAPFAQMGCNQDLRLHADTGLGCAAMGLRTVA
jgi:hypothetical protein